jgi:NADPH:quinone reductase-like Zn-dependent oxidoreductase
MKAMVHTRYGTPEVMELQDVPEPTPSSDEVLLEVRAAGVNWADFSMVRGMPYLMRLGYGLRRPRSGLRGSDVAGVVSAVGDNVTEFSIGDDVFGWCKGAFAEYACAKESNLTRKPADLTFEEAAATPMAGMVALQALRDMADLKPGQKVLINGASGGIGSFAVQIAKAMGAEVTGVCSTQNTDMVQDLGADHVIDYTTTDFTKGDKKYDVILDIADRHSIAERRRVMTEGGTLIPNSGRGGPWFGSVGRIIGARLLSPFVSQRLKPFLSLGKKADLETLVWMIEAGQVSPVVGRTFSLSEAAAAVAYVGDGHVSGKAVIVL